MRKLKTLTINGLLMAALVAGLIYGVEGAMNVAAAYICFAFGLSFLANSKASIKRLNEFGTPAFPRWLHSLFDGVVIVLLAWHGHFFLAGAWLISCLLCAVAWDRAASEEEAA